MIRIVEENKKVNMVMIPVNLRFFNGGGGGEDKDSKTEQPTEHKKKKARGEGQVAKSEEVATAAQLIIMFFFLRLLGGWVFNNVIALFQYDIGIIPHSTDAMDAIWASGYLQFLFQQVILIALPLLLIAMTTGFVANLWQVGWQPTSKPMMPKFSKFNPISGFKKIISMQSLVKLVKSLAKLGIVGVVIFFQVRDRIGDIPMLFNMDIVAGAIFMANWIIDMVIAVGALFILVAIADYAYTRYEHIKKLKMTKQEVKDEMKQMDGDPLIKSKIRQKMMETSMRRMMQNVPEADVVITNPTHYAVALRYNNMIDKAPVVVAKGVDFAAKRIREKAQEHSIAIVENPTLARALYADVEVGDEIPYELWESVVEILAYVFKLKNRVS